MDFTGPKTGLFQFTVLSANMQLHFFYHTQFSLSFILPRTDETTCSEFLMSTTKTEACFSFSLLHAVRTASCFLYHLCGSSTTSVFASIFSIFILQCFILSLLSHRWTNSHWYVQKQVMHMSRFSFRFNFSCIWPISSTKTTSINLYI